MGPNNPGLFGKIAQLIQDYWGFMNPNNPRLFGKIDQLIQDYWDEIIFLILLLILILLN